MRQLSRGKHIDKQKEDRLDISWALHRTRKPSPNLHNGILHPYQIKHSWPQKEKETTGENEEEGRQARKFKKQGVDFLWLRINDQILPFTYKYRIFNVNELPFCRDFVSSKSLCVFKYFH